MSSLDMHPIVKEAADNKLSGIIEIWRVTHRFDTLDYVISTFLDRGLDGATMVIREAKSGHSVTFAKSIYSVGQYGIQLTAELDDPQIDEYKKIEERCRNYEPTVLVKYTKRAGDSYKTQIDCGTNVDVATDLAAFIFAEIFNLPSRSRFHVETSRVSRWREVIDSPTQEESTPIEGLKLSDQWSRQTTGSGTMGELFCVFAAICQVIGTAGLVFSLVFHTYVLGLVFASLIVFGFVAIFTNVYWSFPKKRSSEMYVHIPKTFQGLLRVVLFRPFNWISIIVLVWALFTWISI